MTHPGHGEEHLAAILSRYEEDKASIIGGLEPLPETEAIDLRALPPVPAGVGDDAPPVAVFHDNVVVADVPGAAGRRPWWRRVRFPDGGAGRL